MANIGLRTDLFTSPILSHIKLRHFYRVRYYVGGKFIQMFKVKKIGHYEIRKPTIYFFTLWIPEYWYRAGL